MSFLACSILLTKTVKLFSLKMTSPSRNIEPKIVKEAFLRPSHLFLTWASADVKAIGDGIGCPADDNENANVVHVELDAPEDPNSCS